MPWSRPHGAARDAGDDARFEILRSWNATLADAGYGAVSWPRAYGGREATPGEEMAFNEEMALAGAPGPVNSIGVANIGPAIMAVGTDEQQQRYLLPMLRGDEIWCQGMSEPDAGSDLASLRTRAELDGDHFVVNGQKTWTSDGHRPTGASSTSAPTRSPQAQGHLAAARRHVQPRASRCGASPPMAGDTRFCEVWFNQVRVPVSALLGELHDGWRVATTTTLGFERAGVVKLYTSVQGKLAGLLDELRAVDPESTGLRRDPQRA